MVELARNEDHKMTEFVRGCDVLIMDAQYEREEYNSHRGWGHACLDDVVAFALEAKVKQLFLFHHDPEHDDKRLDQMVAHARELVRARKGVLTVEAAREGDVVELNAHSAKPA
jgi:ribonuclease BN (tRNA processing enzyme)